MANLFLKAINDSKDRKTIEFLFRHLNRDYDTYPARMKARIILRALELDISFYWLDGTERTLIPHLDLLPLLKLLQETQLEQRQGIIDTWLVTHPPTKETSSLL